MTIPHSWQAGEGLGRDPGPLPRGVWLFTLACYAICVLACLATRDYGFYFDDKYYVESVRVSFESGVPLPRRYHYPSLGYAISLLAALPAWALHGFDGQALAQELGTALSRGLAEPPRLVLDARVVFAAVSYLALVWVALLAWRLSRSRTAACAAVAALALSFEFHYHARFWAPDAPMAQFVVLSVLCAHRHLASGARRDFYAAAITAGLAAGTKFPGALALAAVGVAVLLWELERAGKGYTGHALARAAARGLWALVVLAIVFLLTTPGLVLDAEVAVQDVSMELRHYRAEGSARGHGPYTVDAGWDHSRRMGVYLASQALSYAQPAAWLLFACALFGAVQLARRDPRGALLVFSVPVLYLLYFSYQRLLFVRNLEVLLPFLAVAFGLGAHALLTSQLARPPKRLLAALLLGSLGWNAVFLVRADRSILARDRRDVPAEIEQFVAGAGEPVFLAPKVLLALGARGEALVASGQAVVDPRGAREALVFPADLAVLIALPGRTPEDARANWPGIYQPLAGGPWEVNFSYYPTWKGDVRPLRISGEYYRALSAPR